MLLSGTLYPGGINSGKRTFSKRADKWSTLLSCLSKQANTKNTEADYAIIKVVSGTLKVGDRVFNEGVKFAITRENDRQGDVLCPGKWKVS